MFVTSIDWCWTQLGERKAHAALIRDLYECDELVALQLEKRLSDVSACRTNFGGLSNGGFLVHRSRKGAKIVRRQSFSEAELLPSVWTYFRVD